MPKKILKNMFLTSIIYGLILGVLSIIVSSIMERFTPAPPQLAGSELFKKAPMWWIFIIATIWGPIFETIVAQVIPVFIMQKITEQKIFLIVASATLFSVGHFLNGGGAAQVVLTFLYGLVFATVYVSLMPQGLIKAAIAVTLMHATNNAIICAYSFIFSSKQ